MTDFENNLFEEQIQDLLSRVVQRTQDNGGWQLTTTVNTYKQVVFRIKFEIQPRTTVRDNTCVIQYLTGGVGFTLIAVKEHTRATMQLGYDNSLGTVDNESTVLGHERNFAHVDFLFFNVFYCAFWRVFLVQRHAQFDTQRSRISYATDLALFYIKDWLTETIANVLQLRIAAVALDREDGAERRFQTVLPFRILLDKLLKRVKLDGE